MTTNLSELFDEYALRARVYPGLLTSLPIVVAVLLLWPDQGLQALWPVIIAVGGTFFLANFVRSRGKRLEAKLIVDWDGMPTTHMLRHREVDNAAMFARRRRGLERVFGEALPTPREEEADPRAADSIYVASTRALIARVRSDQKKYPRVHEENIHYGFRRNLLALKTLGLVLVACLMVAGVVVAIVRFRVTDSVVLGIDAVIGIAWLSVVNRNWVHEGGQTYAERLFDTLEQDGLTSP